MKSEVGAEKNEYEKKEKNKNERARARQASMRESSGDSICVWFAVNRSSQKH